MLRIAKPVFAAVLFAAGGMPAFAADYVEPPVVEVPPPVAYGGWYIRGDLDYHWASFRGADYITYGVTCCGEAEPGIGSFDTGSLKGGFSLGAGVGYQINNYFRTDLTADYLFNSDFDGSTVGFCAGVVCGIERSFLVQRLVAARQRLCRYRHMVWIHALCRRRHRRRAC